MRAIAVGMLLGVLSASAGFATAQGLEDTDEACVAPCLRLELGASPTQSGFKLTLAGAEPRAWALLCLKPVGQPLVRQWVHLDEFGGAEIVEHNYEGEHACEAWFVLPRFAAQNAPYKFAVTSSVQVPARSLTAARAVQRGDVIITEIMKDPSFVSDTAGEWFEVHNRTNHALDLEGWSIADLGSNHHTIDRGGLGLSIAAGGRLVLGINANSTQNGGIPVAYKYANFSLTNGADAILLRDGAGMLVDQVSYDDGIFWPDTAGRSISLDPTAFGPLSNDHGGNWCAADTLIGGGNTDRGTPGLLNATCP